MNRTREKTGEGLRLSARNLALFCLLQMALSFMFVPASIGGTTYTYTDIRLVACRNEAR